MNEELVTQAIDALTLKSISVRESTLKLHDGFDPLEPIVLTMQTKLGLRSSETCERKVSGQVEPVRCVRGVVEGGVRLTRPGESPDKGVPVTEDQKVAAEFVALFVVEYELASGKNPTEDSLNEFLSHNATYHVWSYLREYAQASFARAMIPNVTLPMLVMKPVRMAAPPVLLPAGPASDS